MNRINTILFFIFLFGITNPIAVYGQKEKELVQVSGLVVSSDSNAFGIISAFVYVKSSGRGAITNSVGYFSFPCLAGDLITVSHLGYKKQTFSVPSDTSGTLSYLIEMVKDTTILPVVEISYFPTEKAFKKAILNASLSKDYSNLDNNLNNQIMERLMASSGTSASLNYSYYINKQVNVDERRYLTPSISVLDPFAWRSFIKGLKKRKKKK
ncbi:MAG: carboxypeptidase-like regulatory domain-containing protein [Cyclobacteriaceae bacterium]